MKRALIIKTGHSETFDESQSTLSVVSLGDVLRTTVVLHLLSEFEVTWLTSPEALPLLDYNKRIKHLTTNPYEITDCSWDLVINLEKTESILQLLKILNYKKLIGFCSDLKLQTITKTFEMKDGYNKNWSEKLFLLFNHQWNKEPYLFFPKSNPSSIVHDLGLNWKVGTKWSSKSWPFENWESIHRHYTPQFKVSWQQGFENIDDYVSWIQSCKSILTHDSLGLHLGLALGKDMVALFGPTNSKEIPMQKTRVISHSESSYFACEPCYKQFCHNKIHCVSNISVKSVKLHLNHLLQGYNEPLTAGWK